MSCVKMSMRAPGRRPWIAYHHPNPSEGALLTLVGWPNVGTLPE